MCGILFYFSKKELSYKTFHEALTLQRHRGPDNTSIFFNDKSVESFEQFSIKQLKIHNDCIKFIERKKIIIFNLKLLIENISFFYQ